MCQREIIIKNAREEIAAATFTEECKYILLYCIGASLFDLPKVLSLGVFAESLRDMVRFLLRSPCIIFSLSWS